MKHHRAFAPELIEVRSIDNIDIDKLKEQLYDIHLVVIRQAGKCAIKEFTEFGEQLGRLEEPLANAVLHPEDTRVEVIKRKADDAHYTKLNPPGLRNPSSFYWHADRSFLEQPSFLTLTRIVQLSATGGATDFINTAQAYVTLDDNVKEALSARIGVHDYAYYHECLSGMPFTQAEIAAKRLAFPPVNHRLVQPHPITGEPVAYLSPLTLQNMSELVKDSSTCTGMQAILDELAPTFYRHHWQLGDIVVWDNFGVLHRGRASTGDRQLERLTIALPIDATQPAPITPASA